MSTEQNKDSIYIERSADFTSINPFKIKNGSKIQFGNYAKIDIRIDQHFNWFQKLMWKWCFGFTVEDYSEE